jgi:hypothetical protein
MPSIPCSGCVLTGLEDLRYFSLSFIDIDKRTLASLGEFELVRDPGGYVTVIAGFGAAPPSQVTPANYYTYIDLSSISGFARFAMLGVRTIIPSTTFKCSAYAVRISPARTTLWEVRWASMVPSRTYFAARIFPRLPHLFHIQVRAA